MMRELIEKEVSAAKRAVETVREWLHPTTHSKDHAFDRQLDDLGQPLDDVERQAESAARAQQPRP
jgi:hypothetical protein